MDLETLDVMLTVAAWTFGVSQLILWICRDQTKRSPTRLLFARFAGFRALTVLKNAALLTWCLGIAIGLGNRMG